MRSIQSFIVLSIHCDLLYSSTPTDPTGIAATEDEFKAVFGDLPFKPITADYIKGDAYLNIIKSDTAKIQWYYDLLFDFQQNQSLSDDTRSSLSDATSDMTTEDSTTMSDCLTKYGKNNIAQIIYAFPGPTADESTAVSSGQWITDILRYCNTNVPLGYLVAVERSSVVTIGDDMWSTISIYRKDASDTFSAAMLYSGETFYPNSYETFQMNGDEFAAAYAKCKVGESNQLSQCVLDEIGIIYLVVIPNTMVGLNKSEMDNIFGSNFDHFELNSGLISSNSYLKKLSDSQNTEYMRTIAEKIFHLQLTSRDAEDQILEVFKGYDYMNRLKFFTGLKRIHYIRGDVYRSWKTDSKKTVEEFMSDIQKISTDKYPLGYINLLDSDNSLEVDSIWTPESFDSVILYLDANSKEEDFPALKLSDEIAGRQSCIGTSDTTAEEIYQCYIEIRNPSGSGSGSGSGSDGGGDSASGMLPIISPIVAIISSMVLMFGL